jgi:hypothetical protein
MDPSFYAQELMVKERVNAAIEEGLRSQAFDRSGAPRLSPFHGLQQFIQKFLNRRTGEHSLSTTQVKPLVLTFVRVAIAITILLIFMFFG